MNNLPNEPGIYYALNLVNFRIYIGKTEDIAKRIQDHLVKLRSSNHPTTTWQHDWDRHGEGAFEFGVLSTMPARERRIRLFISLGAIERAFIDAYQSDHPNFGYNTDPSERGNKAQAASQRLNREANEAARKYRLSA